MFNLSLELKDKRILILDDLVDARSSLKKMVALLGALDANIDTASNGIEASQYIAENDYQIVLSDYNLERGKDGQQVLEEARYTNRLKATSLFVMITGENAVEMVMGALEYDPDSYITKPYTLNMLKERLQRIMLLKRELHEINTAIDKQDLDLAITLSEQLLEEKPKLIVPLTRILGKLYIRQKNYQKAQDAYEFLLEKRSASWAYLGQATCIYHLGDPRTALALLGQTLQKHPLYVQCHDLSATILLSMKEPVRAQKELEKAVNISPKAVLRQIELGRIAFENADYPVAIKALEQAIKLGRFSCYKNSDSYLNFIKVAQKILASGHNIESREVQRLVNKASTYSEEVKQEYVEQNEVLFDTSILDSEFHLSLDQQSQAQASLEQAEKYLLEITHPNIERQLTMVEALIKTKQDVKAQSFLNTIKQKTKLAKEYKHRIAAIETNLNRDSIDEHINQLNSQGIELYSKKDYPNAIIFFDNATAHEEASISVLMNAIQTKISAIEQQGVHINYLKDCQQYFERIGPIEFTDKRYERYQQLKNSFSQLWQKAGLS